MDLGGRRVGVAAIDLSLDGNHPYRLDFLSGAETVGSLLLGPQPALEPEPADWLARYRAGLPEAARTHEFDAIVITPLADPCDHSLGHLPLMTEPN